MSWIGLHLSRDWCTPKLISSQNCFVSTAADYLNALRWAENETCRLKVGNPPIALVPHKLPLLLGLTMQVPAIYLNLLVVQQSRRGPVCNKEFTNDKRGKAPELSTMGKIVGLTSLTWIEWCTSVPEVQLARGAQRTSFSFMKFVKIRHLSAV